MLDWFMKPIQVIILLIVLLGAGLGGLRAQDGENEAGSGMRLENELKIPIPDAMVDEVWKYVQARYAGDEALWGSALQTAVSVELFVDTYYDTPEKKFLENQNGLRHRWRKFPNGDIKELVQIKLTQAQGNSTRGELKFGVRPEREPRDAMDNHPLMLMMDKSDRPNFIRDLAALGVDVNSVNQTLVLTQNRHRVYIKEAASGKSLATVTLDHMEGRIGWLKHKGVEMELELNEINYTEGTEEQQRRMEAFNDAILADLLTKFPALKVDLTPKYNKSHELLARLHPVQYRLATNMGAAVLVGLAALALLALPVLRVALRRPKRPPIKQVGQPGNREQNFPAG